MAKMRLILTGASGFLGSELLRQLAAIGAIDVLAVTRKTSLDSEILFNKGRLKVVTPDNIIDDSTLMADADLLLNCAFPRNVEGEDLASGMEFIAKLFKNASEVGVRAVVNVSSQSVYSQHRTEPAVENAPLCLESKYAVAKYASELLLEAYCADIPHTNIRLASLIGPGFNQRVINKMGAKAITGEQIIVQENGSHFGYLDVKDAARGLIAVVESNPTLWSNIYNLGPSGAVTLTDIATEIVNIARENGVEIADPIIADSDIVPTCTSMDASLFGSVFNWKALDSLKESAKRIMGIPGKD